MLVPSQVVNLHRRLVEEKRRNEARFEPLRDKYKVNGFFSVWSVGLRRMSPPPLPEVGGDTWKERPGAVT